MGLKIYIVDDHALFREGLHYLLKNCNLIDEIREANDGKDFLQSFLSYSPDIVLMDIEMPGLNGIETTSKAIELKPELKIIALSMYADESYYSDMIKAGAKGFLLKNSKFDDVQNAIREVNGGRNYFSPEILSYIVRSMNQKAAGKDNKDLTKRELEVLLHICRGLSNIEISEQLCISKRTVDKHRENILLKTEKKNTAELVVYAIKKGYFEV